MSKGRGTLGLLPLLPFHSGAGIFTMRKLGRDGCSWDAHGAFFIVQMDELVTRIDGKAFLIRQDVEIGVKLHLLQAEPEYFSFLQIRQLAEVGRLGLYPVLFAFAGQ